MERFFEEIYEECRNIAFLEKVIKKAHYEQADLELLGTVLEQMLGRMHTDAAWSDAPARGDRREVVMTLGAGVDALQDEYLQQGLLTEAYMVEVLGSEILLAAYSCYNRWVGGNSSCVVERYHFLGSGEYPLEGLKGFLERSRLQVHCTEGYCMVPKKSVVFVAQLAPAGSAVCESICLGCGRKDCPNRMEKGRDELPKNMMDHPLTYGYAKIFGLR